MIAGFTSTYSDEAADEITRLLEPRLSFVLGGMMTAQVLTQVRSLAQNAIAEYAYTTGLSPADFDASVSEQHGTLSVIIRESQASASRRVEAMMPTKEEREAEAREHGRRMLEAVALDLGTKYGDEIGLFLAKRIASAVRKATWPYDNLRVADKANPAEMLAYGEAKGHGCCGFYDDEITHYKSGRTFMCGFNFGH